MVVNWHVSCQWVVNIEENSLIGERRVTISSCDETYIPLGLVDFT